MVRQGSTSRSTPPSPEGADRLRRIEQTERRLWLLALFLFLLFALSLFLLDTSSARMDDAGMGLTGRFADMVQEYGTSIALAAIILLICAYFHERLARVRGENRQLVVALGSSARILAQRNRQLDTWAQLSHNLITNFNLPRLLDLIVHTAAEVTGSDCAAVMVAERPGTHLRVAAIHERGLQTDLARRAASDVVSTGHPLYLRPDALPPDFDRPDLSWEELGALAAAPLSSASSIVGALLVGRLESREVFAEDVMEVLQSFANQASVALEKAHLYAENQKQLDRLAKLLHELGGDGAPAVRGAVGTAIEVSAD